LAGTLGVLGLLALYRGLATGRMGIVAPVSAVVAAMVPVLVGAALEGLPGAVQVLGFGLALVGVWLLSRPERAGSLQLNDLALPVAAGLGFGLFFVFIHQAGDAGTLWPLVAARLASVSLMLAVTRAARQAVLPARPLWVLTALAGVLDAGGNAFFVLATQAGRLDVAGVLSSLYPASTVLLAWAVLRERFTRPQLAGVTAALLSVALIAA
jgi:drug/metabolite transporter (DMT)-like permease